MNTDALHSALVSLTILPEQIRSARENVAAATSVEPSAFDAFLNGLERDLRIAKATLAHELGFATCSCCWPPELSLTDENGRAYCPASSKTVSNGVANGKARPKSATGRVFLKPRKVDRFTRAQKEALLRLRDGLVDSISGPGSAGHRRSSANGSAAIHSVGDRADAGNDALERDSAMNLLAQGHGALVEVDHALKRIDAGTYGICEISGQPIPRERLEALPAARYTIECQAQMEQQQKARRSRSVALPSIFEVEGEEEDDDELPINGRNRGVTLSQRVAAIDSSRKSEQVLAG